MVDKTYLHKQVKNFSHPIVYVIMVLVISFVTSFVHYITNALCKRFNAEKEEEQQSKVCLPRRMDFNKNLNIGTGYTS